MRIGSWITVPADPAMVFEKDPTRVWSEIVGTLGEDFACTRICPSILPSTSLLALRVACDVWHLGVTLDAMSDPSEESSVSRFFHYMVLALLALPALLAGCGVAYTIVKSESKFDKLSVPMTKAQVVEEIGGPDRVLRDDGRMLVWEYSLTARRQWLYELGLCPVSIWIGCIIYPFTNIAMEHQREYPHHVVLVNDELCAWGPRRHPAPQSLRVHRLQTARTAGTTGRVPNRW